MSRTPKPDSVRGQGNKKRVERPLWRCPKCGKRFVTRNAQHSCRRFPLREHLRGKSPEVVLLYQKFAAMVRRCGPVIVSPSKTGIAFQVRMRFAGCRVGRKALHVGLALARPLDSPRVLRIDSIGNCHTHYFRINWLEELDDEFQAWLREAYSVGMQEHLASVTRRR